MMNLSGIAGSPLRLAELSLLRADENHFEGELIEPTFAHCDAVGEKRLIR